MEWVDCKPRFLKVTMKYPAIYLLGEAPTAKCCRSPSRAKASIRTPARRSSTVAPNTTSSVFSKSISRDGGRSTYRGLLEVADGATGTRSKVVCDALLLDENSSRTPTRRSGSASPMPTWVTGHRFENRRRRLFLPQSRGLSEEELRR